MTTGISKGGRIDVRMISDCGFGIRYRSESDLRASLAEVAALFGWDVEEEVVVPGWGRIDLVLRPSRVAKPYLVELKLALKKPNEVRRAFQQADGYGRWWTKEKGEANTPLVVADAPNLSIVTPVADAYPAIPFRTVDDFLNGLRDWHPVRERFDLVENYTQMLRDQLAKFELGLSLVATSVRRTDEKSARAEFAAWIAADESTSSPKVVDF